MGKLHVVENRCGDLNLFVFTPAHIVDTFAVAIVVNGFFLNQTNMNILFLGNTIVNVNIKIPVD